MERMYQVLKKYIFPGLLAVLVPACKKAEDRACFKSLGEPGTEVEVALDSVERFNLYKNLRYHIYQDDLRKVIIRGGSNVVNLVEVQQSGYAVSIRNKNACNFLRNSDEIIEVEIHYPYLKGFYIEPSDSVIFENTIEGDSLFVELRYGGGSARLDVDLDFLNINVSHGTADYTLTGHANNAEIKIQNNGFANALGFNAGYVFLYNNSTGNLNIDLEGTGGTVQLDGTGNIGYTGSFGNLEIITNGSGQLVKL